MASVIRIFDNSGREIDNIVASTKRSWITAARGAEGDCTFTLSTLDPKCTERNLRFGNIILIEHDTLPDWVGVIDCDPTERQWSYGKVSVTAYSAERLLKFVASNNETVYGTSGGLFTKALEYYNMDTTLPIFCGYIDISGQVRQETFGKDVFTHVQRVASRSSGEWNITHKVENGKLSLYGNWFSLLEYDTHRLLFDGANGNIELAEPIISEGGLPIYNTIVGYSDAPTSGTRLISIAKDEASRIKYGVRTLVKTYTGITTQSGLDIAVAEDLSISKEPMVQFEFSVINPALFPLVRNGNIFDVNFSGSGFTQYGVGYEGVCRIYAMEYDDEKANAVKVGVEKYVRL